MMADANTYGTVGHAQEQAAFLPTTRAAPPRAASLSRVSWSKLAVGTAVAIAGLGYCASLQSSLNAQQAMLLRMQEQLDAMHAATTVSTSILSQSAHKGHRSGHGHGKPAAGGHVHMPYKLAVEHVTPLKTQDNRGTCWDFATVAVLEHSYRMQGIQQGFLEPNEYLALSEQAYGAEVLRLCSGAPGSPQQVACLIPGNQIWKNSTEGGESAELYYLVNGLKDAIFPVSTCPYMPDDGNDTLCEPLQSADVRNQNPLRLEVRNMETYFEETAVKNALLRDRRAMAFTTSMPYLTHYYPCLGEAAESDPRCQPSSPSCTMCPPSLGLPTTCCLPLTGGENYNMHGEFLTRPGMTIEGGHVMTLTGFNDGFRTRDGLTGGFILKNSWFDGIHPALGPMHARGSHSLQYWMQEVSDWEERAMCPNSFSPSSWYQCGSDGEVIHARGRRGDSRVPLLVPSAETGIADCLSNDTQLYASTNLQPLHLQCTDDSLCDTSNEMTYFVHNATNWGDRMTVMCLFEYHAASGNATEFCLPPMLEQDLAYVLRPIESEVLPNDPDVCGFYFYPYEVLRQYNAEFGNFYVNNYEIEWHASSYAANKKEFPELDYTQVEASTRQQNAYKFVGPFPFAQVVDADAWTK